MSYEHKLLWYHRFLIRTAVSRCFRRRSSAWQERLQAGLGRVIQASDQTMGHLEEEILHKTQELERAVLEEASSEESRSDAARVSDLREQIEPGDPQATSARIRRDLAR